VTLVSKAVFIIRRAADLAKPATVSLMSLDLVSML
jgi:hypothetical protein